MELQNKDHQSAWLFAAMGNHTEVVELLRANREAREKKAAPTPAPRSSAPKPGTTKPAPK